MSMGEEAGQDEEGQEGEGQPGVVPGPPDKIVPYHRVGRLRRARDAQVQHPLPRRGRFRVHPGLGALLAGDQGGGA
ncbi:MAG TPA: hypothetical protein VK887_16510, partial [Pseudonocardiaceae bacterium]|nr:hypothetical protein [Pseudonocardiaceae bacterium]